MMTRRRVVFFTKWVRGTDGFKCVGVHEIAETALLALPQEKPSIVLIDINLPGLNGIECVLRLKPQMMDTQFVVLTIFEDPDRVFKALSFGASGYMLKRTPRAKLLKAIQDVQAGGSLISSTIARKIIHSFQKFSLFPAESNSLSPCEREILDLLAHGYLNSEISDSLHINMPAVNSYIRCIYEKLHVRSRSPVIPVIE